MKKIYLFSIFLISITLLEAQTSFTNVAGTQNIDQVYVSGIGGGVSFYDFDNDGWDDLTLATAEGSTIQFYKNSAGNFVLQDAFVDHQGQAEHPLWVDFDNDGDNDLYVTTVDGTNKLYRNNGGMDFTDITETAGLPINEHRSFGACWGDIDRDGWLDLYYGERKFPINSGINENRLFRNNADGTFTEITVESGAQDPDKIPFCSSFIDYNNDQWPDIYTTNDKGSINTLLKNNGDGTFADVGELANANLTMDGMGIALGGL